MAQSKSKPDTPPDTPTMPRKSRWWKRYLRRLTVLIVALLLIVGGTLLIVQIVLWSGIPRNIAISTIRSQTGLDTSVGSVELSLMGGVKVREVELTLPETAVPRAIDAPMLPAAPPEPFARVDSINAKLSPLPLVAIQFLTGGKPSVELVDIQGVTVDARQYEDGTWNLVRIAEQVQRSQAKPTTNTPTESGGVALPVSLPLPKIDLRDITVHARDKAGNELTITPISLLATSDDPLHWTFDLTLPPTDRAGETSVARTIRGNLVPAGRFDHQVSVKLPLATALAEPILPLPDVNVSLNWVGDLVDGVDGKLHLNSIDLGGPDAMAVSGNLTVNAGSRNGPIAQARVVDLAIENVPSVGTVSITSGLVRVEGEVITLTNGRADFLDGSAAIRKASFNLSTMVGSADLNLDGLTYAGNTLNGDAKLSVSQSGIDGVNIQLDGKFDGNTPTGPFAVNLQLTGSGEEFTTLQWNALLDQGKVQQGANSLDIPAIILKASTTFTDNLQQIYLEQLATRDSNLLTAEGGVRLSGAKPMWWFYGAVADLDLTVPRLAEPNNQVTLAGLVDVWGELPGEDIVSDEATTQPVGNTIVIDRIYGSGGGLVVTGSGRFTPGEAVDAELADTKVGDLGEQVAAVLPLHLDLTVLDDRTVNRAGRVVDGNIRGRLVVDGDPDPENWFAQFTGSLDAMNLKVADQRLDNITGDISGTINAQQLTIATKNVEGLGGTAQLDLTAPLDAAEPIRGSFGARNIELEQIGRLANLPPLSGTIATADFTLVADDLTIDALNVDGSFAVSPESGSDRIVAGPLVVGESLTGDITLRGFDLSVDNITATSVREFDGSNDRGTLTASAFVSLNDLKTITVSADADNYLIDLPALNDSINAVVAELDAEDLIMTFVDGALLPSVDGSVRAKTALQVAGLTELVEVDLQASAADRAFVIDKLLIGLDTAGELTGSGRFPFDEPTASTFKLTGRSLDLSPLITRFASETPLGDVSGIWSVNVDLKPATAKRPLAPLQLDVDVLVDDGGYQGMSIEGVDIRAFADLTFYDKANQPAFTFTKFVTEYAIVKFADGTVDAFARVNRKVATSPDDVTREYLQSQVKIEIGLDRGTLGIAEPLDDSKVRANATGDEAVDQQSNQQSPPDPAESETLPPDPLNIGQLITAANVDTAKLDVAGLVGGQLTGYGDAKRFNEALASVLEQRASAVSAENFTKPATADAFTGNGRFNLTKLSISGNVARDLGAKPEETDEGPTGNGEGTIRFTLYRGDLRASDIDIFTNGIQIRGAVTVENALFLADPPLNGYVVALARPLKDIGLPFFGNADELFSSLQSASGVTAFRVQGTLKSPEVVPATFAEFGDEARKVILGDAQNAR